LTEEKQRLLFSFFHHLKSTKKKLIFSIYEKKMSNHSIGQKKLGRE